MNNIKKIATLLFCFCLTLVFSACSLGGSTATTSTSTTVKKQTGSFLKSFDGGKNWENKVRINDTASIGLADIISMEIDPLDTNVIYIGTEKDGLLVTKNGGDSWEKMVFPLTRIFGLAIDKNDNRTIYASGVLDKRAKIYKSSDRGVNDSVISSLKISNKNPKVLYCGTSQGMIFKSIDSGQSWKNLTKANGPVIDISFDSANDNVVYFGVSKGTILMTKDGGGKIEDLERMSLEKITDGKMFAFNVYSIETDPRNSGVLYVGTDSGIWRGTDFGGKWEEINILESSKKFPVRAIAVNPQNSNEISYSNSGVIYKSVDNGTSWLTFQLTTEKTVDMIEYNPISPDIIYAGLRKI
jgi:photosystem II stability/assembly factor-like uncharacterized protein